MQLILRGTRRCCIMVSVADDAGQGGALFVLSQHHHHPSSSFFFSFVHHHHHSSSSSSPRVHHLCCSLIITTHHGFFSKPHLRHLHSSSLLACQDMVLSGPQDQEGNSATADLPLYCIYIYIHIFLSQLLSDFYLVDCTSSLQQKSRS